MFSLSTVFSVVKTVGPLSFGFLIGALLSLAVFPTIKQNHLDENDRELPLCPGLEQPSPDTDYQKLAVDNAFDKERFEAIVHPPLPSLADGRKGPAKVNRPRFYATELGIKDKLFVGILTSTNRPTLSVALNRTTSHHVNKIVFFHDEPLSNSPPLQLNLVALENSHAYNRAVKLLEYLISKKLARNYDWFYVAPDTAYSKGFKLYELVTHISIGSQLIMGRRTEPNAAVCDFNAGILISRTTLEHIGSNIQVCRDAIDERFDSSENLGRCIVATGAVNCSEEHNGKTFRSWKLTSEHHPIEEHLEELNRHDAFNAALSVFPLEKEQDFYTLHKHFCQLELDQLTLLNGQLERVIQNLSAETGDGSDWPTSVPSMWRPKNRFEVFKWEFFTDTHIFKNKQNENVAPLAGADRADVEDILRYARNFLKTRLSDEDESGGARFERLLSGYRLFDPTRGMCYVLDLVYSNASVQTMHRVHAVRPLTRTEIIHDVPYVTEETNVTMIVPIGNHETDAARGFLLRYSQHCLADLVPKRYVRVVFAMEKRTGDVEDEPFVSFLADIAAMRKRCHTGSFFDVLNVPSGRYDVFAAVDTVVDHFGSNNIYLLLTPHSEFNHEFLNRVRINTIKSYQVFFPIAFVEFDPRITSAKTTKTAHKIVVGEVNDEPVEKHTYVKYSISSYDAPSVRPVEVHKNRGHFDVNRFSVASFYGADYVAKRAATTPDQHARVWDVAVLFLGESDIHLLRAVEPALKERFHDRLCPADLNEADYSRCLISRREGLGSKAQIAALVLAANQNLL